MSDISAVAERIGRNVIARDILEQVGGQPEAVASLTTLIESDVELGVVSSASAETLALLRESAAG